MSIEQEIQFVMKLMAFYINYFFENLENNINITAFKKRKN